MIRKLLLVAGFTLAPSIVMGQTPLEFIMSQAYAGERSHGHVTKPRAHTSRRLGCADNVNLALRERSLRGSDSSRALDFLNWGRSSRPVPGAVAVYRRKGPGNGHVAIVSRVKEDGTVCIYNPNRRGWREICRYGRRAIAYRVPEGRYASR